MKYCCEEMKCFTDESYEEKYGMSRVIVYDKIFTEYGIIVNDGGNSSIIIKYCPWCGRKLIDSKRELWFEELNNMGYESPFEEDIPLEFQSDEWWKKNAKRNK